MDDTSAGQQQPSLRTESLPARFAKQNLAGYVRDHVTAIDSMVSRGVSYATIREMIVASGFDSVTSSALGSALWRARRTAAAKATAS